MIEEHLPHNLTEEQCILGCIMFDPESVHSIIGMIREEEFYAEYHQKIFAAMCSMAKNGEFIDAITLVASLQRRGDLEAIGGWEYIHKTTEVVPNAFHADTYCKHVRELALRRTVVALCQNLNSAAKDITSSIVELIAKAESTIATLASTATPSQSIRVDRIVERALAAIISRQDGVDPGVQSGFANLDEITGGFRSSEVIVLGARPAAGKTALVGNIATAVGAANCGVLVFSLEQGDCELVERMLCAGAKINGHTLRKGTLDEVDQFHLMEYSRELSTYPVFIDSTPGRTISQIASISRHCRRMHGIGLVIVDYLGLVEPDDKRLHREQQVATTMRRLKILAKELEVPVIVLAQLNRDLEKRDDKRPRLADLRESGSVEQDADAVLFLHRPHMHDDTADPTAAEIIVAKNRSGPTGRADLVWRREMLTFADKVLEHVEFFQGDYDQ